MLMSRQIAERLFHADPVLASKFLTYPAGTQIPKQELWGMQPDRLARFVQQGFLLPNNTVTELGQSSMSLVIELVE